MYLLSNAEEAGPVHVVSSDSWHALWCGSLCGTPLCTRSLRCFASGDLWVNMLYLIVSYGTPVLVKQSD